MYAVTDLYNAMFSW